MPINPRHSYADDRRARRSDNQRLLKLTRRGGERMAELDKLGDERIDYRAHPRDRVEVVTGRRCSKCGKKLAAANRNLDDLCYGCQ